MQTGSGKTHTMLGEIDDLEVKPSPHRGMTPRIFEFLFARIQAVIFALFASVPFKICLSMYILVSICFSIILLILGRGKSKRRKTKLHLQVFFLRDIQ
jgi:hypothetical protein